MNLILVGTNHRYSPIELRERISFSQKRLKDALNFLSQRRILKAAVILSTCNRIEVYASTEKPEEGIREIEEFISRYHEIDKKRFLPYFYRYTDKGALRHLYSVASGLDSLILGETQILSQVKSSFAEAEQVDFVDGFLRELFIQAATIAKKIHRETKLSEGKVSVGSVAIDFIKQRLGSISDKNFLIIGLGKVTELLLQYLKKENPNVVFVSNRTFDRAGKLAGRIGAEAIRFADLKEALKKADVVISATASPHFVIKKETLQEVIGKGLLIIDLALPRDVQPGVKELSAIELFNLEDLEVVIKENKAKKAEQTEKAKQIIDIEIERLCKLIKSEQEPALLP
jgi:glutamyl-tRNA reductase